MKKIILILFGCFFIFLAVFFLMRESGDNLVLGENAESTFENKIDDRDVEVKKEKYDGGEKLNEVTKEKEIPVEFSNRAPFLSQAPFQKWDALHEDACEEASLIMVKYSIDNKYSISPEKGEKEIQALVGFEKENKYGLSITLDELKDVAEEYYGMENGRVEKNMTIADIKKELAEGRLVIVGAAGKILPNPNFRNGGPNYHMLVIKGYDEKGFITNDPGTRLGENFRYGFSDLYKSIHDWNEKNILNGEKNYLVFD